MQQELLTEGAAVVSATVNDRECAAALLAAEASAREAKRGIWADPAVIKNAESPGDILVGIGRIMLVEGKVLSVRQAGATTYLNFWTELDTGLRCDYSKAGARQPGGRRP